MDMNKYEESYEAIQKTNDELLELFEQELVKSGMAERTIQRHLANVNFYINNYLLREEAYSMKYGVEMIDDFLGNFFIRKCMWSTPQNIKTTATSIKQFYKVMLDHEKISKSDYDNLCTEIKDGMEVWQGDCAVYNDPEAPNPFFFL